MVVGEEIIAKVQTILILILVRGWGSHWKQRREFLTSHGPLAKDSLKLKTRPKKIIDSTRLTSKTTFQIDSLQVKDSLRVIDSLRSVRASDSLKRNLSGRQVPVQILKEGDKKVFHGKEYLFYY